MSLEATLEAAQARRPTVLAVGMAVLAALAVALTFREGLASMWDWWASPEYQHGYLIPLVSLYLIWARAAYPNPSGIGPSWAGVAVVGLGLLGFLAGELSAIYTVIQYAFLLTLWGLALTLIGWAGVRHFWAGLFYLVFMIPLPAFFQFNLSNILQLWSSEIGTWVLRLLGVSVYLEGNVIDLGIYKLQVAEACSGLRYLFPLGSFGFFCAYVFKGRLWQRAVIFASAAPIAILMNSFRISVTGILVARYGIEQAEGFLHYFEGWVIFVACIGILFLEMALFAALGRHRLADSFTVEIPEVADLKVFAPAGRIAAPAAAAALLLLAGAAGSFAIGNRQEAIPQHVALSNFPLTIGEWQGTDQALTDDVLGQLRLTDYLMATYQSEKDYRPVQLYVAYYGSQRKGASVHSPRACLPSGGWQIESFERFEIPQVRPDRASLPVNRALISMGPQKNLVYYWFMQRGRYLTNEFAVKWYIFWDSLTMNRTDGAMVRVMVPIRDATEIEAAEARALEFIRAAHPRLYYHIPQAHTAVLTGAAAAAGAAAP